MKKTLLFVCLSILGSVTVFAQTVAGPQVVHTERSAIHVPPQEDAAVALKKIYSNLGPKADPYNDTNGWLIDGPNSSVALASGLPEFIAMAFTPKYNSTVEQVQVAVQYIGSGADQINLSIYADSGGDYPGTLLAGPVTVTNLPVGTLTLASFSPVAVTAGTKYWVVADTPLTGTGSDFTGTWHFAAKNMGVWGNNDGSGWFLTPVDGLPAGEVLGTIP